MQTERDTHLAGQLRVFYTYAVIAGYHVNTLCSFHRQFGPRLPLDALGESIPSVQLVNLCTPVLQVRLELSDGQGPEHNTV